MVDGFNQTGHKNGLCSLEFPVSTAMHEKSPVSSAISVYSNEQNFKL